MGSSQYASSFGRLQSISINFISEEFLKNLLKANSVTEMVKQLESTWYGEEIKKAASVYKEAELLEVAFNRHIVETNRIISEATPFGGKNAVRAYLSKWDLYNIELILSSKAMGREITETESLLVSSRNVPAGITAGNISHDEFKLILSEPTVEGVVNKLAKYDYGVILMKYLDEFQKTGDLGPMMSALHESYYQKLLESIKFFQGDEGSIRELIRAEIDKKNVLNLLKAKESNLEKDIVSKHLKHFIYFRRNNKRTEKIANAFIRNRHFSITNSAPQKIFIFFVPNPPPSFLSLPLFNDFSNSFLSAIFIYS